MNKEKLKIIKKLKRSRVQAQERGNLNEEAEIVNALGETYTEIGDHEESLQLHKEELALCQASGDTIGQAIANRKIGESYACLERYMEAIQHQTKHLELAKLCSSDIEQQRAFATIGRTYLIQAEDCLLHDQEKSLSVLQKAVEAFNNSLRVTKKVQESKKLSEKEVYEMKVRCFMNLGLCSHNIANLNLSERQNHEIKSKELFQKALHIARKFSFHTEVYRANILLTVIHKQRTDYSAALRCSEAALQCAKSAKNKDWQREALVAAGEIYMIIGNSKAAKSAFKKAYKLSIAGTDKDIITEKLKSAVKINNLQQQLPATTEPSHVFAIHEALGDAYCGAECYQAAIQQYKKQEKLFGSIDSLTPSQCASVLFSLALTYFDMADYDSAVFYYKKELNYRTEDKELAKTWTQIAHCLEKDHQSYSVIIEAYQTALTYALETEDDRLQLKIHCLMKELHEENDVEAFDRTKKEIQRLEETIGMSSSQVMSSLDEENAAAQNSFPEEDSEDMLREELDTLSSDDSDNEEIAQRCKTNTGWRKKINEKGETALHRACIEGNVKRVNMLLQQSHPINPRDYCGWTPLHEACNHGHTEIVDLLIKHKANINDPGGQHCGGITPTHDAAALGHFDIVYLLLQHGANYNVKDQTGKTAIEVLDKCYSDYYDELDFEMIDFYKKIKQFLKSNNNKTGNGKINSVLEPIENVFESQNMDETLQYDDDLPALITQDGNVNVSPTSPVIKSSAKSKFSKPTVNIINSDSDNELPDLETLSNAQKIDPSCKNNDRFVEHNTVSGVEDYCKALAGIGSSKTRSKMLNKNLSKNKKRSITDDVIEGGLINDNTVGDDWLVDDDFTSGKNLSKDRPSKRFKMNTIGENVISKKQAKLSFAQNVSKTSKTKRKSASQPYKKLITTKIHQFMVPSPESSPRREETDDDSDCSEIGVQRNIAEPPVDQAITGVPSNNRLVPDQPPVQRALRVKVKINGKMFLIAVPGSMKTVSWLTDRASAVYKQATGLEPTLLLYTSITDSEEDACLLSKDDLISDVLQSNDHVLAKVQSWNIVPLSQRYAEACHESKTVIIDNILNACKRSANTGILDISHQGLRFKPHLNPLLRSVSMHGLTSIQLPANSIQDEGVAILCQSLGKHLLDGSTNQLSVLNLSCIRMTRVGLRTLSQASESQLFCNLTSLDLSYNQLTDGSSAELAQLLSGVPYISHLRLARCYFTQKLFQNNTKEIQAALQNCTNLETIDISMNDLGSTGVELLLQGLNCSNVTTINLSSVSNASNNTVLLRHIQNYISKQGCSLHELRLSDNSFSLDQLSEFISFCESKEIPIQNMDVSKNLASKAEEINLEKQIFHVKSIIKYMLSNTHITWTAKPSTSLYQSFESVKKSHIIEHKSVESLCIEDNKYVQEI